MHDWLRQWIDDMHRIQSALAAVRPPVADPVKPIDVDDVLAVHELLEKSHNLRDLGVGTLCWWRVKATCSKHGILVRYEETTGGPPAWASLACMPCSKEGVRRSCPIEELEIVVGKQVPIVGMNEDI